jgi:hypothetical protein
VQLLQEPDGLLAAAGEPDVAAHEEDGVEAAERLVDVLQSQEACVLDPATPADLDCPGGDVDRHCI